MTSLAQEKKSFTFAVFDQQVYIQVALYSGVLIQHDDRQCITDLNCNDSGHTSFCVMFYMS